MMFRTFVPLALIVAGSLPLAAQEVRVEVVKHADGRPIPGTLLTLLSERDTTPLGRFSDESGRATFNTPRRGGYRIRAERVGYDTWTSAMLVPSSNPTRVRAGMKLRSLRLPPVTGATETHCANLGEQATAAGDMWGEIRKALAANKITETQGIVSLNIETYDRLLDPAGNILSEQSGRRTGNSLQLYRAVNIVPAAPGMAEPVALRVPDTPSLLSQAFVATHCFSSIRGSGAENGLLGLEFKPAKLGSTADLSGILWLDPTTYSLRHLVFEYVNVPPPAAADRTTGRVEFQPLSGGEWIVSRWSIRTPRAARAGAKKNVVEGYHESVGVARPIGRALMDIQAPIAEVETGETRITGSVFDGTTGRPIPGVAITTTSGRYRTVTNSGGGYELRVEGRFVDTLLFDHPRLRLLRVSGVKPVAVGSGGQAQVGVLIPALAGLRQTLCPAEAGQGLAPGLAVGYVHDAFGKPIANAQVSATCQVLWTQEKGRLVATNQQRTVDTQTAADGSYLLCGFTRDARVTMGVAVDGTPRATETIALPRSMILERDFRIPAR